MIPSRAYDAPSLMGSMAAVRVAQGHMIVRATTPGNCPTSPSLRPTLLLGREDVVVYYSDPADGFGIMRPALGPRERSSLVHHVFREILYGCIERGVPSLLSAGEITPNLRKRRAAQL